MINKNNGIPCPVCKTNIPFDVNQLLAGVQFTCPNCLAVIGLSKESAPKVEETIKKLKELEKTSK